MKKSLDKKEILLSLTEEPVGKNNLSSRASFMQEKLYHQTAYKEVEYYLYVPANNFYYDSLLYGRVDQDSFPITLKTEALTQIRQADDLVKCQNFVADAFSDFYNFWNVSKRRGFLEENSSYYNIKPLSAYKDPKELYTSYIEEQNSQFYSFIDSKNITNSITSFESFVRQWISFVEGKLPMLPFTFSSFCVSRFSDPKINGLIIDLSDDDKTDDNNKYNKFIKDPNFIFFSNLAQNYGFSIDKKIPWRLIANINSKPMNEYLNKFNLNSNNLFLTNYSRSNLEDFNLLKNLIFSFYQNLVSRKPAVVKSEIVKCKKDGFSIKNKVEYRSEIINKDDYYFLRLYLFLKARENNLDWDQAKFEHVVQTSWQLLSTLDIEQTMRYAHRSLNVKSDSKRKNTKYSF